MYNSDIGQTEVRRLTADWPRHISYDISNEEVKAYYNADEGSVTWKQSFFYEKRLADIFLCAMSIGKKNNNRRIIKNKKDTIRKDAFSEKDVWLMIATALSEDMAELAVLENPNDVIRVCEEYANAGIEDLMYIDKSNPQDSAGAFEAELKKIIDG